jgi:hypothetical protein
MKTLILGIIAAFLAIGVRAEPIPASHRKRPSEPPNPRITRLVLPQIKFEKLTLGEALQYLERKAEMELNGALKVSSRIELPDTFQSESELTLELRAIPFPEVLRYVSQLAGVQLTVEGEVIVARPKGPKEESAAQIPPMKIESPRRGAPSTSLLNRPGERSNSGNNVHRAVEGTIQPEKSGRVPHRGLSGWSTKTDPKQGISVNCPNVAKCPGSGCGCKACTCRRSK